MHADSSASCRGCHKPCSGTEPSLAWHADQCCNVLKEHLRGLQLLSKLLAKFETLNMNRKTQHVKVAVQFSKTYCDAV